MSEFNFKSRVCTDKNQSERLLALGLKKETADYHWRLQPYYNDEGFDCGLEWSCNMGTFLQEDAYELFLDYIPAWSLGRLVEMMPNSIHNKRILAYLTIMNDRVLYDTIKNETYSAFTNNNGLFAAVVDAIEWLIKDGYFNKEYLEDRA